MYVKNKETGAVETMQYGSAVDAVTAGTHEFANGPSDKRPEDFTAPELVTPPPNIIVVQAPGANPAANPVVSNAAPLDAARKRVTAAEAAAKSARTDADKAKADAELKAAKEDLAKLGG